MRISWLRLGGVNYNKFMKIQADLKELILSMLINVNNIEIDNTIFNEYLDYESNRIKNIDYYYVLHPLHNFKLFRIYFLFCMNAFINKCITIKSPFTGKIISTNNYFILTEDNGSGQPRTICNYYFNNEKLIVGFNLGLSASDGKGGGGPMHLGLTYVVNLQNKQILNIGQSQYQVEIESEYFKSLLNVASNFYETFQPPKSMFVYGMQQNIGHNMQNELTGLYLLDSHNVLKHVDTVLLGHSDAFDAKYIFEKYIKDIQTKYNLNEYHGVWKKGVCLSYNHTFISNRVVNYLRSHFETRMLCDNTNEDIQRIKEDVEYIRKIHCPVLHIVVRLSVYHIVKQDECFTYIINKLLLKYPNLFILFDGFIGHSNNKNTDLAMGCYDTSYSNSKAQHMELVKNITQNIKTQNFRSLIGMPYYSILQYTDLSTVSLSHIGSGGTVSYSISKPDVIYVGRRDCYDYMGCNLIIIENTPHQECIDNKYIEYDDKHNISKIDKDVVLSRLEKYVQANNEKYLVRTESV